MRVGGVHGHADPMLTMFISGVEMMKLRSRGDVPARIRPHPARTAVTIFALTGVLVGCGAAAGPVLSEEDRTALTRLGEVAGPSSGVAADSVERTECWLPSAHPIDDPAATPTSWRVLCRVHWTAPDGAERAQDATCIGDFAADPMIERCYRWTHYDLMPRFEDEPAVEAP